MRKLTGLIGVLAFCACVTNDSPTSVEYQTHERIIGFYGDSSLIVNQFKWKIFHYGTGMTSSTSVETIYSVLRQFNYRTDKYSELLDYKGYVGAFIRGNGLYLTPPPTNAGFTPYRRFDLVTHGITETNLRAQDFYMSEDDLMLYECRFGIEKITALSDGRPILTSATGAGGYCACTYCHFNIGPKWYLYNHFSGFLQYRIIDLTGNTSLESTNAVLSGKYYVHSMGQVPYSVDSAGVLSVPAEFDSSGKLTETFRKIKAFGPAYIKEIKVEQGLFIEEDSLRSISTLDIVHIPHDFPESP